MLAVDDDPGFCELIALAAEELELEAVIARDAFSAVDVLTDPIARGFHLALVDIGLPGRNGFEAADDIRRVKPDLPIVFITGRRDPDIGSRGEEAGGDDLLEKPWDYAGLLTRLQDLRQRYIDRTA